MKRPLLYGLGAILVIVALGFVVNRMLFLASAERTVGHVSHVQGRDTRCGSRRSRHACTRFDATVDYVVGGATLTLDIDAGRTRGHGAHVSTADVGVGDAITVVHAPGGRPAYQDTFFAVWGTPLITFFIGLASAFGGWREKEE